MKNRIDPDGHPWSFRMHPWTFALHNLKEDWIGQKAAQMGFTETAINRAFFSLDVLHRDVLYLLPKKNPDASDFSAARFNPALDQSPYLKAMFGNTNNVGHKQAGVQNLYVRGTQSTSGLKSIPAPVLIWDELNEMSRAAMALGEERASGKSADVRQDIKISTPTIPEFGISDFFGYSSQSHYFFPCPHCSRRINLELTNLVITADDIRDPNLKRSHLKCGECGHPLDHKDKPNFLDHRTAEWVPAKEQYNVLGFRVPQFYSCFLEPYKIATAVLLSRSDGFREKELHRSKLALPFVPQGARILPEDIAAALRGYRNGETRPQSVVTLGIDQGKWLHCTLDEWYLPSGITTDVNSNALCRNLRHFKVPSFEDIDPIIRAWNVGMTVIDANPERRKAYELSTRFPGRIFLCFYNRGISGKQINVNTKANTVSVDRTSWLDVTLARFQRRAIELPSNTEPEFSKHLQAIIKEDYEDQDGNAMSKYVSVDDDHYAHAKTYSEIAVPLLLTIASGHSNISDVL